MRMIHLRASQDTAVQLASAWVSIQRAVGVALVVCGGLADGIAGWLVLPQGNGWSLLIHVPVILAWGSGLCLLQHVPIPNNRATADTASSARAVEDRTAPIASRWTIVLVLLGLVGFPGFVPLAWCAAYGFTRVYPIGSRTAHGCLFDGLIPREEQVEQLVSSIAARATEQTLHREVEPLVDVVHDADIDLRRGAIAVLGKQGDRTAGRLIRSMLNDSDPDVRSDASVILARLETTMGQAISSAAVQSKLDPSAANHYADLCYRYAISDLLDETSSRFYLVKAKIVLRECLACQAGTVGAWVLMAQIHNALGERAEAMRAVQHALALDSETPEIFLLGTEIAFRQRDWATLRALAIQASTALRSQGDLHEIMGWWAEIPSKPTRDDPLSPQSLQELRTIVPLDEAENARLFEAGKGTI